MELVQYKENKANLISRLNDLTGIARRLELSNAVNDLNKSIQLLGEENFQLVVVGEFSRGKSTFVNAMLGKKILPSSVKPTTAIITRIGYDDSIKYTLHYRKAGQPPKNISDKEFNDIIAPRESFADKLLAMVSLDKQKKIDEISYADISYPLDFCQDNVNVVDTPGTNDLNTGRMDITYNYVEKADAVILVMAANQPLTQSELEFLEDRIIGNQIKDIFFVINYKDALSSPDEELHVKNYIIENLHSKLPGLPQDIKIYMVSSLQALLYRRQNVNGEVLKPKQQLKVPESFETTGFIDFEQGLSDFLSNEKGRAKIQKYASRGCLAAKQVYENINLRIDMAGKSLDEIVSRYNKLEPEFRNAKQEVERLSQRLRSNLESEIAVIKNMCAMVGSEMRSAANSAAEDYDGSYEKDDIKRAINRAVSSVQKNFVRDVSAYQTKVFKREVKAVNADLQRIWTDIHVKYDSSNVSSLDCYADYDLDLDIAAEATGGSTSSELFGAAVGAAIGGAVAGPLGFLFGGWLGASFFEDDTPRITKKTIKHSINMNFKDNFDSITRSVTSQYEKNVNKVCRGIVDTMNSRIDDLKSQLDAALREKKNAEIDTKELHDQLSAIRLTTKQIYEDLSRMKEG